MLFHFLFCFDLVDCESCCCLSGLVSISLLIPQALETTEDNVQAAVFWLLENPQVPEPAKDVLVQPSPEATKDAPTTATTTAVAKEAGKEQSKDPSREKTEVSAKDYNGTESVAYILQSAYDFPQTWRQKAPSKGMP
jgi:hypothetical protein